jgi:hypothetical protein
MLFRVDITSILLKKELTFKTYQTIFTFNSGQVSSDFKNNEISNSSNIMPNDELFLYGRESSIGKRCFLNHAYGSKTTKVELCRIHETNDSFAPTPVYFLLGDSLAMTIFGAFKNLPEYPGMFAALHGGYGSPFCHSNISNPTKTLKTPDGIHFVQ